MVLSLACLCVLGLSAGTTTPEQRAIAYLAREVPRWSGENHCYSCHNNGDAARALFTARRLSQAVPDQALADTVRFLTLPARWDQNGGDQQWSDKQLAHIQFAAALVEARAAGFLKEPRTLTEAARLVAADQRGDGSWAIDAEGSVGSPVTYGTSLATYLARQVLNQADAARYRGAIARADAWFRTVRVRTVLDAAAVLRALEGTDEAASAQRHHCLAILRKGQSEDGGWGPYVTSPSEPFDTALVLLTLAALPDKDSKAMLRAGRAYLVTAQKEDGSWPETTRPPGRESYAQRLSTAGWATLALLATRAK